MLQSTYLSSFNVMAILLVLLISADGFQLQSKSVARDRPQAYRYQMSFFGFNTQAKPASSPASIFQLKSELYGKMKLAQPNGIGTAASLRQEIDTISRRLEKQNPTSKPAYSDKMNGFWKMDYTDYSPPAASAGKLGPFIGDVYQDLDSKNSKITNLLKIGFPPIKGGLVAKQRIFDANTW
jgi:hypothetical protein